VEASLNIKAQVKELQNLADLKNNCRVHHMKKIKSISSCLVIVVMLLFLSFQKNQNASVAQKLKNIPQEERLCLDFLFRSHFSTLGYCLFGSKPIAVIGYDDPLEEINDVNDLLDDGYSSFHSDNLKIYRGWKLWQKYQHLFPMSNYAFIKSKNFSENNHALLVFINKEEFKNVVQNYLNDFREILGDKVTPELLLEAVLQSKDIFGDVLKHHQGLIGTVLGFGRHNAWLFHQREEISSLFGEVSPLLGPPSNFIKKLATRPSHGGLDALNRTLQSFDNRGILDFNPLMMSLPGFAADPNASETKVLKAKYEQQYRQIIHRYQKGDFLEITLQQMTSGRNSHTGLFRKF
jgi:hypothetical protein